MSAQQVALNPTEREIVRLVAEGHTNGESGQHLFVSVHTVKKHLSHVYARVGLDGCADRVARPPAVIFDPPRRPPEVAGGSREVADRLMFSFG